MFLYGVGSDGMMLTALRWWGGGGGGKGGMNWLSGFQMFETLSTKLSRRSQHLKAA